jgi:CAAX protease family protein
MDPENDLHPTTPSEAPLQAEVLPPQELAAPAEPALYRIFIGPDGLRAGWSVFLFILFMAIVGWTIGSVLSATHLLNQKNGFTPQNMFFNELASLVALVCAASLMAVIEHRRLADYNLRGPRGGRHFFSGLAVGFAALSLLVGELAAGHWLSFHGAELSGMGILRWGLFWGCVFLMVGCVEEGAFRCYLQFTFTRGLNFWWALGIVALLCGFLAVRAKGNGVWGDYLLALLGVIPCFILHQKAAPRSGFWQAAWVTSTLFGFIHTGNGGENMIGIFAAGAIGFVFCVSIRVTGSAWWAIGAHAGWDWGETYFYGTPDSGLVAKGHLLNTTMSGNLLWSGGANGPEGSLLIVGILVLLLAWLLAVYGRRGSARQVEVRVE